ncbi:hypothetical protein BJY00DRAFT_317685 [Aspergillus carlsbadensis]|nr:hypothetical protein BJY00DRAFT_317685 [Aspergillus carlsbadensis]
MKLALSTLIVPLLITAGMAAPIPTPKSVRELLYCLLSGVTMLYHFYCVKLQGVDVKTNLALNRQTMSASKPVPRQLQGGTLAEALSNAGGLSGFLKSVKLPLAGDALGQ